MPIIEELKKNVTPEQVIERYTGQLKPISNKYLCPFHDDHRPSLTVKAKYCRCWSCGYVGDIVNFTSDYFRISTKEAIRRLADDFGISEKPPDT